MEINRFSHKNILLLLDIDKRGKINSRDQTLYGGWSFYGAIKFLEKRGLVANSGTKNKIVQWVLTNKGKKFVHYIKIVEKLVGGDL